MMTRRSLAVMSAVDGSVFEVYQKSVPQAPDQQTRQALFGLAWFRDKGDIPRLGAGFGLPQSAAYRYLDEVIEVVAARVPGLQEALERALAGGCRT